MYGGMEFKSMELYDYGVKYRVLLNGEADVTVGFTTAGSDQQGVGVAGR